MEEEPDDDLLPELPLPTDAGPIPDEHERAARWSELNRRAQLGMHESGAVSYTLYADHPAVRAELATLVAAEAAVHPELDIAALVGEGHLVLAVEPSGAAPARPRAAAIVSPAVRPALGSRPGG